jgi:hypothetical protein
MSKGFADPRDANYIASANQPQASTVSSDYTALGIQLERRGIKIDDITRAVAKSKQRTGLGPTRRREAGQIPDREERAHGVPRRARPVSERSDRAESDALPASASTFAAAGEAETASAERLADLRVPHRVGCGADELRHGR